VSQYQKGKTNLDFTEARDNEWQWHHLGYMQVCTSLETDNHASTPPLSFLHGRMPFLPPNQQQQSTEAPYSVCSVLNIEYCNLCNSYLVVDHTFFMNITLIKSAHMSRMIYSFVQLEVKYSSIAAKCICPSSSLSIGLVAGIYDR